MLYDIYKIDRRNHTKALSKGLIELFCTARHCITVFYCCAALHCTVRTELYHAHFHIIFEIRQ